MAATTEPGMDWIDPATGHRIIRLSTEPGSASLYFHQNAFTSEGDLVVIVTPEGLASVNLKTRKLELAAPGVRYGMDRSSGIEVGRKTRSVYYQKRDNGRNTIYVTQLDTRATRKVATLPFNDDLGCVNADETLLFGAYSVVGGGLKQFFTINIKTGEIKTFFPSTDNLNHAQCSPTDPMLALYCHEGRWASLDRIWTIHLDGTNNQLMHQRTMPNEIAGHEFFTPDGQMVMYDLQTPEAEQFWLAGVNVYTGQRIRYPLERSQWSAHYNASHDGKLYAGEGGGPKSVANRAPDLRRHAPRNGQWIYLFKPRRIPMRTMKVGGEDVQVGAFDVEKLVDLSKQDYALEPNLSFTPDDKWIIFRSNMSGQRQVYAVEVAKP